MRFETRPLPGSTYSNGVRRHPRTLFSVPITVRSLEVGGVRSSHGISLDISEGGMGALLQTTLQVGEKVKIDLPLPMNALSAVAVVRHSSKSRSGFEFVGLSPDECSQIAVASRPIFPEVFRSRSS
jgi:hypothetical protein